MSSKLQRLISHYEGEHRRLEAEMDEFLAEKDYGMAHRCSKALMLISQTLQTLMNLHDPLHDEKESIVRRIERIEELVRTDSRHAQGFYLEWIAAEKLKLLVLQSSSAEPREPLQAGPLHTALIGLLEKRITTFTLVLSDASRLCLNFKLVRRTLLISLPEVKRHRADYCLRKKQIRCLQGLGFRLYDCKDKLLLLLPFADVAAIRTVKTILARIAFDCFYYKDFQQDSSLKYYEPAGQLS